MEEVVLSCHSRKEKKAQNAYMALSLRSSPCGSMWSTKLPRPSIHLRWKVRLPCQLRQHTCHQEMPQSNMALRFGNIIAIGRGHFSFPRKTLKKEGFLSLQKEHVFCKVAKTSCSCSDLITYLNESHWPHHQQQNTKLLGHPWGNTVRTTFSNWGSCFLTDSFLEQEKDIYPPHYPRLKSWIFLSMRTRWQFPVLCSWYVVASQSHGSCITYN